MRSVIAITLLILALPAGLPAQENPEDQVQVELGRSAEEYFNIGNWFAERDQHYKAIAYFKAALAKKNDFNEAWINMGSSFKAVDRFDDAITAHQTAIDNGCDQNFVYLNLGNAMVAAGRTREATLAFRIFTELEPYDLDGYTNLGITLYQLKDYAEAAAAFEKLLVIKEDDSYFLYQTARCYALLEKYDKTLEKVQKALEIDPNVKYALLNENDFKDFRRSDQFKKLLADLNAPKEQK